MRGYRSIRFAEGADAQPLARGSGLRPQSARVPVMKFASWALIVFASSCTPSAPAPQVAPVSPPVSAAPAPGPSAGPPQTTGANSMQDDLIGKAAPDFTAVAQNGKAVHLASLRGKSVVIYFYPKDETPGCTKEACSFRDAWQSIATTGAVLIGVSADSSESHLAFAEHYKLPFLLVTDADGAIARLYGVPFEGRHRRQTVVVGADGIVHNVYRKVDVTVHAAQILEDLSHAG